MKFRLLVDFAVIDYMASLPRRDQAMLRNRFLQIQDFPQNFSDYRENDAIGRPLDINLCARYAIKYWTDSADRHVKILDLHLADRGWK
jgi:hypothetical protein